MKPMNPLADIKRDLPFFGNVRVGSFRIQNTAIGANYPIVKSSSRTGRLVPGVNAILLGIELSSTWESGALNVITGASVGLDQGAQLSVANATNLWIHHYRSSTAAGNAVFSSSIWFQYPFCPILNSNQAVVGYATDFVNGASDIYEGIATVYYFPIDQALLAP